ncbi:hypothetical protein NB688_003576 [Xanthomonas sacchari]|uniref:Uncharacterized protein n=1 Tax=Xanthomonas sacchari TaxID=56458 RepID=A0ABT3DX68_9XANT|nr:hypothetical protein [Xanthomonas sacchari]MCW0421410.1 hypothetical protein [Xanthomonas sacchari]
MRVRGEAIAHQNDTRLRPRACRRCDRCFPRLRPSPHPPLRGTFSRWEKGARCAWSPSPAGRGVGVRVRGEAIAHQNDTRLCSHPCPPPRSMSPQAAPVPSSAPSGHLLPAGEGSAWRLEPLSPRERGWGEGTGRSHRASERHQASPARLSAAAIDVFPGFARPLIRPCGAPSPDGRRERAAMECCWCCALRRPPRLNRRAIFTRPFPAACYGLHPQRRFFAYHGRSSRVPLR